MKKPITVALLRDLEKQVLQGKISYSRMVEVLNEKAEEFYFSEKEEIETLVAHQKYMAAKTEMPTMQEFLKDQGIRSGELKKDESGVYKHSLLLCPQIEAKDLANYKSDRDKLNEPLPLKQRIIEKTSEVIINYHGDKEVFKAQVVYKPNPKQIRYILDSHKKLYNPFNYEIKSVMIDGHLIDHKFYESL